MPLRPHPLFSTTLCGQGALHLLPHESAWKRGEAAGLTIDDLLPVNLPLAQSGHHVLAHCVLPVLGIWLWLQVRELAQIVF